jgi:stage II sporulation protein AA (anti-sigma F factor antagonist)
LNRLSLRTDEIRGVSVAHLEGRVDKLAVEQARSQLDPLAAGGKLVIDLDRVSFIDSAGLHALFGVGRVAATHGGSVALSVPSTSRVARAIAIVRIADAMPVCESVQDAAAALGEVSLSDSGG